MSLLKGGKIPLPPPTPLLLIFPIKVDCNNSGVGSGTPFGMVLFFDKLVI